MEKASFVSRFIAWLIDMLAIGVLSWIVSLLMAPFISMSDNSGGLIGMVTGMVSWVLYVLIFFFGFFYFGYLWSKRGQSIGMKLLNVKVLDREGGSPTFLMAGLRGSVGYWISGLIFGLGYIWAAFDAKGEAWHDKIFHTHVVRA